MGPTDIHDEVLRSPVLVTLCYCSVDHTPKSTRLDICVNLCIIPKVNSDFKAIGIKISLKFFFS